MSGTSLPVPDGHYPPFEVVTDTDHTAWIIISTALGLSFILVFSGIRIFNRYMISPRVGLDETFLAVSTILAIVQSSVILGACAKGLGKSIEIVPEEEHVKIQQMYYVSILFFVISLGLSKMSVGGLLLRLTPQKKHRKAFNILLVLIAVWTIASTFSVALQCNLSHPWILIEESCPRVFLRWQLISVFDIAFELALVGMTLYLVWGLQTSIDNKLAVIFAFGTRIPLIVAIAYRLKHFNSKGLTTNPLLLQDKFIVWTQVELSYSIIAATIPGLRPFMKTLSTYYGTTTATGYGSSRGTGYGAGYSNVSDTNLQSESFQLSSLVPKGKGDEYKYRVWSNKTGARVEDTGASQAKEAVPTDAGSVGSGDSQRMIIKKSFAWEVTTNSGSKKKLEKSFTGVFPCSGLEIRDYEHLYRHLSSYIFKMKSVRCKCLTN